MNGALNGLPISTSCAHFPLFSLSFSRLLSLSLSLARSLLHLPFFVFLILSRSFVASFPVCQLTQVVSRSGIYITCFFYINIPVLPIILNYYFRPSKWALSDEAFFWGLPGVISLQSPSSCSPALPFSLFHLVRFRTSSGSAVFCRRQVCAARVFSGSSSDVCLIQKGHSSCMT